MNPLRGKEAKAAEMRELAPKAKQLRAHGLNMREIAESMGISQDRARALLVEAK